jgi:hypothetical protein
MPYLTINEMGRMELDDSSELGKGFKIGKIFKPLKKVIGTVLKVTPIGIVATIAKKQLVDNPRKKAKKKAGRAEAAANADADAQAAAINAQAAAVESSMASSGGGSSYPPESESMLQPADQSLMTEMPPEQSMNQQMMTPQEAQSVAQAQATAPEPIQYEMPAPVITEGPRGGGHMTEQDWGYTSQETQVFDSAGGDRGHRGQYGEIQDPFAAYQAGQMEGFLTTAEKTDNLTIGHRGRIIKKPTRDEITTRWNGRKNWMRTLRNPQGNKDEWISPAFQNFWGDKRTMRLNPRPYLEKRNSSALPASLSGPHGHHGGGHHGGGSRYVFPSYPIYPYPYYDYPPASFDYVPTDNVEYDKKSMEGMGRIFKKKKKKKHGSAPAPTVVVVPPPYAFPMGPPPPMPAGYDPKADDEVPQLDLMTQQEFVRAVKSGSDRSDRTGLNGLGRSWFKKKKKKHSTYFAPPAAIPPTPNVFWNKKTFLGIRGVSGSEMGWNPIDSIQSLGSLGMLLGGGALVYVGDQSQGTFGQAVKYSGVGLAIFGLLGLLSGQKAGASSAVTPSPIGRGPLTGKIISPPSGGRTERAILGTEYPIRFSITNPSSSPMSAVVEFQTSEKSVIFGGAKSSSSYNVNVGAGETVFVDGVHPIGKLFAPTGMDVTATLLINGSQVDTANYSSY